MKSSIFRQLLCLLAAFLGLAWLNLEWLGRDLAPLAWDQAHHWLLAHQYKIVLSDPATWTRVFSVAIKYPYLFHLSLAAQFFLFGESIRYAAAVNLFWLFWLMLATWLIGRRLIGGWLGVAAAVLLGLLPVSAGLGREVLLEICLAATVSWTIYLLILSDYLQRRRIVLWLGFLAGLGMLAKWFYPALIAAPVAWCVWRIHRDGVRPDYKALGWALLICLGLSLPWYLHSPVTLFKILFADAVHYGETLGYPPVWSIAGWLQYPGYIFNEQMLLVPGAMALAGVIWAAGKGRGRESAWLLLWLLGGHLLLSLLLNKDLRFNYPLLPAACLLAFAWLKALPERGLRAGAAGLVLVWALVCLLGAGHGLAWFDQDRQLELGPLRPRLTAASAGYCRQPQPLDWGLERLIRAVAADAPGGSARLGVLASIPRFHKTAFTSIAKAESLPVELVSVLEPQHWQPGREPEGFFKDLAGADYLVIKTGRVSDGAIQGRAREMFLASSPGDPMLSIPLPDGSRALLYRLRR